MGPPCCPSPVAAPLPPPDGSPCLSSKTVHSLQAGAGLGAALVSHVVLSSRLPRQMLNKQLFTFLASGLAPLVSGWEGWGWGRTPGTGHWTLRWHQVSCAPSALPTLGARHTVTTRRPPACPLWPMPFCPTPTATPCRNSPCVTSGGPKPCECTGPTPVPVCPQSS